MAKKLETQTEEQRRNQEMIAIIANNLSALAKAVQSLVNGPLKKRALVILLASSAKLPQSHVEAILKALEDLEKDWLN